MKRSVYRLLLVIAMILLIAFPTYAQDEVPPPPCTPEEIRHALIAMQSFDQILMTALNARQSEISGEIEIASVLAWGVANQVFHTETADKFPNCIDSVLTRDGLGMMVNQLTMINAMALLNYSQYTADDVKPEFVSVFAEMVLNHPDAIQNIVDDFGAQVSILRQGEGVPEWLPKCTDEQMEFENRLDEVDAAYDDQIERLSAYLENGEVDMDAYIAIIRLITDLDPLFLENADDCAELYAHAMSTSTRVNDTISALSVALAQPYLESGKHEADIAALRAQFDELLTSYIEPEA